MKNLLAFALLAFAVGCSKPAELPPAPAALTAADIETIVDKRIADKLAHIRTTSITLVGKAGDDQGGLAASDDGPVLVLKKGDQSASIGVTGGTGATVAIVRGENGALLGVNEHGGQLTAHNSKGTRTIIRPQGMMIDQSDTTVGVFIWSDTTKPVAALADPKGKTVWQVPRE